MILTNLAKADLPIPCNSMISSIVNLRRSEILKIFAATSALLAGAARPISSHSASFGISLSGSWSEFIPEFGGPADR
jgi:hypothetical protein